MHQTICRCCGASRPPRIPFIRISEADHGRAAHPCSTECTRRVPLLAPAQEHRLYWCDIQDRHIHSWEPATGLHRSWATPSEPGCCAPTDRGRIVVGLRDGFGLLDTATGHTETVSYTHLTLPTTPYV